MSVRREPETHLEVLSTVFPMKTISNMLNSYGTLILQDSTAEEKAF